MFQTYLENNPNYPPLLWWPPARKSLWLGEERAGVRVSMLCPPPPPEPCKVQGFVLHPTWCRVNPPPSRPAAQKSLWLGEGRIRLGYFHGLRVTHSSWAIT
jgi:hypothetical protein